jgi:hypothetical protein
MSVFNLQDFKGDESSSNKEYRLAWRPALLAELSGHANPIDEFGLLGIALAPPSTPPTIQTLLSGEPLLLTLDPLASRGIISHLGDTPRELLRDPITRRYHSNIAIIIQTLDTHYLSVTRQALIKATSNLMGYSPTKDFKAHVTKHRQIHFTFEQASQALSEMDKVRHLTAGVENDPGQELHSNVLHCFPKPCGPKLQRCGYQVGQ